MVNHVKSFASNTIWGAVASLIATICRMTASIFLARHFTTETNGSYLLFSWFAEFLGLLICLGAPAVMNRFLPLETRKGGESSANSIINWAWKRTAAGALLVSMIYLYGLTRWGATNQFSATTLVLAVILLITQSLSTVGNACLTGLQLFKNLAFNNLITGASLVLLQCGGAYLMGINGALLGIIATNIISLAMVLFRININSIHSKELTIDSYKQIKLYAFQSGLAAFISAIVWSRSELLFLNQLSTPTQAAYFGVAFSLISAIALGVNMLTSALTPHFSAKMTPNEPRHRLQRDYSLLTILTAFFCIPSCIFASALMPILIPLMFGTKYTDATSVAQILVLSAGLGFANVGSSLQLASGNSKFIMKTSLLGASLMFLSLPFAIELYGALGAAITRLAVQVILISIGTRFNIKTLNISFPAKPIFVISAISFLVAVPAFYAAYLHQFLACFLYIPVAIALMVIGLKHFRIFSPAQSVRLYKLMQRLMSRIPFSNSISRTLFLKK